jgi:hypothetical protein
VEARRQVSDDTNAVSALSGRIARLQTLLLIDSDLSKGDIAAQIADTIAQCTALATKYGLDEIALKHGFFKPLHTEPAFAAKTSLTVCRLIGLVDDRILGYIGK